MGRLLTEQGKNRARDDWRESNPTWDEEHHLLIAQDAKTKPIVVKEERQAVAEWLSRLFQHTNDGYTWYNLGRGAESTIQSLLQGHAPTVSGEWE